LPESKFVNTNDSHLTSISDGLAAALIPLGFGKGTARGALTIYLRARPCCITLLALVWLLHPLVQGMAFSLSAGESARFTLQT
jgi:hypothetical protein